MPGPYVFKQIFAADPSNTSNVAKGGEILLFAPGDSSQTPLTIWDLSRTVRLPNPVPVNDNGFGPAFLHETLDQVAWAGGGFSDTFESYRGMKDDAEAAAASANFAAGEAAGAVQEILSEAVEDVAAAKAAAQAAAGLVGAPAGAAVLAAIKPGGAANAELNAAIGDQNEVQVPPLVAAAIATDPTVAVAAAALAQSDAGLTRKTDPGVPVERPGVAYVDVATDSLGRVLNAVQTDGTNYLPLVKSDRRDAGDYVEYTVTDPRYKELVLDADGRIISFISEAGEVPGGQATVAKPWDVFISAGQSNSWITDTLTIPDGIDADARVFQWEDSTGGLTQTPAGSSDHIGWATARHWAQRHMDSARVAVWARSGYGSTGFSSTSIDPPPAGYQLFANGTWDRTLVVDTKNRALELLARITAIKAKMPAGSRLYVLWSQGENDRYKTQTDGMAWYASKLDDLFAQIRTTAADPDLPILVTDMTVPTIEVDEGGQRVNQAQEDTPKRVQRTAFVPGPKDFGYRDADIHWTAQGHGERGRRLAEAIAYARHNKTGVQPGQPRNLRINRSGDAVEITWEPPVSRYTAIGCEISADNGATWAPTIMRHPLAVKATATAPAGTAIRVRTNTTNETATSSWLERKA